MPVKTYGIYIAFPPTVDLRTQGLGRHLASFLKGAANRPDVEFVIACPSWSQETLLELFESEGVPTERLRIVSPSGKPYVLRIYQACQVFLKRKPKKNLIKRIVTTVLSLWGWVKRQLEESLVRSHNLITALPFLLGLSTLLIFFKVTSPLWVIFVLAESLSILIRHIKTRLLAPTAILHSILAHREENRLFATMVILHNWLHRLINTPQDNAWVSRMFATMFESEMERMHQLMKGLTKISAWYSPTAFWPAFNLIEKPSLMCVPDVVLTDFPIGFSNLGGDRYLETFETIQTAIRSANHMVTYSEAVKWNTLIDRYGIAAHDVSVIYHAPQEIARWVRINDSSNEEATSEIYCQNLLLQALQKSVNSNPGYASVFLNKELQFLFYASQFRPNKNVINLLRAYKYLLRKRFVGHKLILTGNLSVSPEIGSFIADHNLENDVLCLHDLNVSELAACYKLAKLGVNPSLSEGGCPFTFTEALSVGTPVVMARIEVSEEILEDPELQEMTFFDPYDWEDMANRIEWALEHRDQLLEVQKKTYERLKQRTWTDVANEHIELLERISEKSGEPSE